MPHDLLRSPVAPTRRGDRDRTRRPTLLRLATAGSVDDGKSTLVGRLLHDSKAVLADQLAAVERVSRDRGLTGTDLALLTDGLRAEREQGITIDVAYRYFATERRSFVLADCPGHVQYTRNTVTGASTADVVVLLVDARKGVLEQTRRHLAVAALLRVPHVVLAVNKIDLVDDAEATFLRVTAQAHEVALGLGVADLSSIPVSALHGDNVVERSAATRWYSGPSLLELLESLPVGEVDEGTLRLPVQVVIRPQGAVRAGADPDFRGYGGRLDSGVLRVGDAVEVLPGGRTSTVRRLWVGDRSLDEVTAPQSVTVELTDALDISRGDVLAAPGATPPRRELSVTVCWLADTPLRPGARLLLKHGTRTVSTIVRAVTGRLDLDSLEDVATEELSLNDIGRVALVASEPLPVTPYAVSRHAGAFLLIDPADGNTLAAGLVDGPGA
jgi:sulfate adenylyltransferase subunit 1